MQQEEEAKMKRANSFKKKPVVTSEYQSDSNTEDVEPYMPLPPSKDGVITFDMSASTAPAKKKLKRRKKKRVIKAPKKTYGLDGIVTSFSPTLLKSYNKFVLKDPKDRMFFYDNYQAMIFNFIEVLPNLDAKKFLVRARSSLIKELF